jgi:hypothetical protein
VTKGTRERVWSALSEINPKSVARLMEETGLSRSTVQKHIDAMDAHFITSDRGRRYYLRPRSALSEPNMVRAWRTRRSEVADFVRTLVISEGADPVWLADQFLMLGRQMTAIGTALDGVKLDPDWYQRLGGNDSPEPRKETE